MNNNYWFQTIYYCKGEIIMKKNEAWEKFKKTGKIEYYLKYKKGN